jgi:hypothetical protein
MASLRLNMPTNIPSRRLSRARAIAADLEKKE